MMRSKTGLILVIGIYSTFFFGFRAQAQEAELTRLKGYPDQIKEGTQFDKARLSGERASLEEEERWAESRQKSLTEYKKTKKQSVVSDEGPEAKADEIEKKALKAEQEKNRKAYALKKQDFDRSAYPQLVTESQELELDIQRPRYDYKKRASFQGSGSGKSSGGSSSSSGGTSRGASPNFPPPPTSFDDFGGGDGGFVPAPNVPDDFGDIPAPPPPPVGNFPDEGFGGGTDFGNDFIPPPPPPLEDTSF